MERAQSLLKEKDEKLTLQPIRYKSPLLAQNQQQNGLHG